LERIKEGVMAGSKEGWKSEIRKKMRNKEREGGRENKYKCPLLNSLWFYHKHILHILSNTFYLEVSTYVKQKPVWRRGVLSFLGIFM
jgi:hypothetical protein